MAIPYSLQAPSGIFSFYPHVNDDGESIGDVWAFDPDTWYQVKKRVEQVQTIDQAQSFVRDVARLFSNSFLLHRISLLVTKAHQAIVAEMESKVKQMTGPSVRIIQELQGEKASLVQIHEEGVKILMKRRLDFYSSEGVLERSRPFFCSADFYVDKDESLMEFSVEKEPRQCSIVRTPIYFHRMKGLIRKFYFNENELNEREFTALHLYSRKIHRIRSFYECRFLETLFSKNTEFVELSRQFLTIDEESLSITSSGFIMTGKKAQQTKEPFHILSRFSLKTDVSKHELTFKGLTREIFFRRMVHPFEVLMHQHPDYLLQKGWESSFRKDSMRDGLIYHLEGKKIGVSGEQMIIDEAVQQLKKKSILVLSLFNQKVQFQLKNILTDFFCERFQSFPFLEHDPSDIDFREEGGSSRIVLTYQGRIRNIHVRGGKKALDSEIGFVSKAVFDFTNFRIEYDLLLKQDGFQRRKIVLADLS